MGVDPLLSVQYYSLMMPSASGEALIRDVTVAGVCLQSILGDQEGNLERIGFWAGRAKEAGAEVIVFPEACLTGYGVGPEAFASAQPIDGPLVEGAGQLARRVEAALLVGLMEKAPGGEKQKSFLTHLALNPRGEIIGCYRKLHLGPTETDRFQAGTEPGLFDLNGTRFGLQLCYDAHFPELSTLLALAGAQVIAAPHASPTAEGPEEKKSRWLRYLAARAYDNTAYLIACNPVGDNGQGLNFNGVALILGPKGEVLDAYAGSEPGLAVARLEAAGLNRIRSSRMGFFRAYRRPELYGGLVE